MKRDDNYKRTPPSSRAEFEIRRRNRRRRIRARRRFVTIVVCLTALIAAAVIFGLVRSMSTDSATPSNTPGEITTLVDQTPEPVQETAAPSEAPSIPPASEQNDMLKVVVNSSDEESKVCYLTFDDGPSTSVTPLILDILRKYDIKATFFEVGSLIDANTDMARRVYEEGHLIGNHSYNHNYKELYATSETFMSEINRTFELIDNVCDEKPFHIMRFPGGSYATGTYGQAKKEYKPILAENGIYYCDWNSLNGDAEGAKKNPQELYEYFVKDVSFKKNLVVLMHDAPAKKDTPASLELIIKRLIDEGYTFKRLDEI